MAEPEILVYVVFPCNSLPVISDLSSLCVLLGPLSIGLEGGLINVCRYITADTWVDVLVPSPSNISVLIEYLEFDAGYFGWEKDSRGDTRKTCTDYGNLDPVRILSPARLGLTYSKLADNVNWMVFYLEFRL